MPRPAGSRNKNTIAKMQVKKILVKDENGAEKMVLKKRPYTPIEDDMDSSVPFGDLKDKTEGYQPRSRMADTRNTSFRSAEEAVEAYKRINHAQHLGHTYLPPSLTNDPDYVYQWCRESVKDRNDSKNIWRLEKAGLWERVDADICPELAFYSSTGEIQDSAESVRDGGLLLMRRFRAVHNLDLEDLKKARQQQNRIQNIIRTVNTEMHPFATGGVDHGNVFFPADPQAAQFSNVFGQ